MACVFGWTFLLFDGGNVSKMINKKNEKEWMHRRNAMLRGRRPN